VQGNTLSDPKFRPGGQLATFDYVVANPPFSDKRWSTGVNPEEDEWNRFQSFGTPPGKQGDYAYLLHIVRSLKSTGTGACILPHGVLFRGNAEGAIRRKLVRSGYIKGIIGLPANLFYGTGIPACIIVVDKRDANARKGIFMIDASKGFMKDGPKNRLRAQDIHRIVDAFNSLSKKLGYSRMVGFDEIEKNEFNLNLPRYIENRETEDIQDIAGHLYGGIPITDIDTLQQFWEVCPTLRKTLFKPHIHTPLAPLRGEGPGVRGDGYLDLAVDSTEIKSSIFGHSEFESFIGEMNDHFSKWRKKTAKQLRLLEKGHKPKELIIDVSERLLDHYRGKALIDPYAVYQHLMDYWADVMQDDCYSISADGWKAETERVIEKDKNGKSKDRGWVCDLVPKSLVVARYFKKEQDAIVQLNADLETHAGSITELEEEHGSEEGILNGVTNKTDAGVAYRDAFHDVWQLLDPKSHAACETELAKVETELARMIKMAGDDRMSELRDKKGKLTLKSINDRFKSTDDVKERKFLEGYLLSDQAVKAARKQIKDLNETAETTVAKALADKPDDESLNDLRVLDKYLRLVDEIAGVKAKIREAEAALDMLAYDKYPHLSEDEIKTLVVDDKWMTTLDDRIHGEMDRISQSLASRVKELAERYKTPMPVLVQQASEFENRVSRHLQRMGFSL
jgi:type I restriction enzyme M protein